MTRNRSLLIVVLAALTAYGNSVFHGFVYDDDLTVSECPLISSLWHLPGLFTQDYFVQTMEMSWRPFATLTLFFDHALFGNSALGYHLMSVLWHAAACVALWWMLSLTVKGVVGPLVGAVLFAVHPLCSESVNAISFREDLLVGFFAPLTVIALIKFAESSPARWRWFALAVLCAGGGCFSKESGAVIPLLAACWFVGSSASEWTERRSRLVQLSLGFVVVLGLWGVIRFAVMRPIHEVTPPVWGGDTLAAVWNFPRIFFHGLKLALAPISLTADYQWSAVPFGQSPWIWAGWAGVALWMCAAVILRRRAPVIAFGLAWYFLALLPVSNVLPLANPVAERYLYLPLMGVAVLASAAIKRAWEWQPKEVPPQHRFAGALACICALFLLQTTVQRNLVWGDAKRLWTATLEVEPRSTTALNNLACIELANGRAAEAAPLLEKALAISPRELDLATNYGIAMAELGRWDVAQRAFEVGVASDPQNHLTHWRLAMCLTRSPSPDHSRAWQEMLLAEQLGQSVPSEFRAELASRLSQESSL